ncbi:MAG: group II intron reverse transcriptase/maturase [Thaumarchaeota archaeon]|nr:group II intron reverse transcriptase/maturase [Nitrososphaerota archaeon]
MAADRQDTAKTQEPVTEARLEKTPVDATRSERERGPLRLGKRVYPVWTPAMVEAREKLKAAGRKWYLLHDKVYDPRNLREAWDQVRANAGAPGLSGETIEEYGKTLGERLRKVTERLREQRYEAQPIRRKWIPKTDGSGQQRPLGIPEVEDRIVQAAIVKVIEPIYERKFLDRSYGFRPERSALHALAQLEKEITGGRPYLVDADIRNCFGSIPHEGLMEEVGKEVSDPKLLALVRQFVEADIVEELKRWTPERGTPQGAVLSPLLANIYMHEFDQRMLAAGHEVIRYADDFVVTCRTQEEAERVRARAGEILKAMGLELHPEKTRVLDTRTSRFQFLGYEFWPREGKPPGREPRASSLKKIHGTVRRITPRCSGKSVRDIIDDLRPVLKGWYGYYKHSFYNVFDSLDGFVRRRLRSILRKREKRRGTAKNRDDNARYPNALFRRLKYSSLSELHEGQAKQLRLGARGLIPLPAKA